MSATMKWIGLSVALLLAVVVLWFAKGSPVSEPDEPVSGSDEIEYRGEKFKITKSYPDFDDYKNDPDNIDPSETDRIIKLVSEAPIASSYASSELAVRAIQGVVFPGYGSSSGSTVQADGS